MRTRDTILLGLLAGAGAAWGVRAYLRNTRRIELTDRVIVITGASSGHGFVLARLAAEQKARLVLAARDAEAMQEGRDELIGLGARDVLVVPTDLRDADQCRALISRTVERYGRVDVLVHNAGVIQVGPLETMTLEDFQEAMATNYWGAVHTTLAALPHMRARKFGRIAFVNSQGGKSPFPHLVPYTASKFALTGFAQAIRPELAKDHIYVTSIYPATMRTGGHTNALFKGNREAEYAWFGALDTFPLTSVSAETVARKLWRGVCNGDPEVLVGWPAWMAAKVNGLAPTLTAEALALVNRALPAPANIGEPAVRGEDLRGAVPGLLNRAVPPQARPG